MMKYLAMDVVKISLVFKLSFVSFPYFCQRFQRANFKYTVRKSIRSSKIESIQYLNVNDCIFYTLIVYFPLRTIYLLSGP